MKRTRHGITAFLLALGLLDGASRIEAIEPLVTHYGLGHLLHPIQKPEAPACACACECPKDHVYIFGVNGLNPLCTGNFNGLCEYLRDQGYKNTYFGQLYTSHWYTAKIREVRGVDPKARIVLIGFSLGTNYVRAIANSLRSDGIRVDLLVYLAGDTIWNSPRSCPDNASRILNINAHGLILLGGDLFFKGADLDKARNERLDTRHILAPSRKETMAMLMEELNAIACRPYQERVELGEPTDTPPRDLPATLSRTEAIKSPPAIVPAALPQAAPVPASTTAVPARVSRIPFAPAPR